MGRRAAAYTRISQDAERSGLGVARQRDDCLAFAAKRGWTVVDVLIDNDLSAYSGKPRPGYQQLCDGIKDGTYDTVIAWHPDRLHRSPRELEDFIDLIEASGALVATCTAGDYDLSTAEGRLMARVVGAVARKESEDKSRRLRRKHVELAEQGRIGGGGVRPFGYEPDRITVRESEAQLLRDAAQRILAGASLWSIITEWTDQGVETVTGAKWSTTALKTILVKARIAGLREHQGRIVGNAVWDPVLDEVTWRRVKAILTDPARKRKRPVRSYLLTGGLAVCDVCDSPLFAAPRSGRRRGYGCLKTHGGCGGVHTLAEPFEEHVVAQLIAVVDGAGLEEALRRHERAEGDDAAVLERVREDEARLEELATMWADGVIGRAEWVTARDRIEVRLAEASQSLATVTAVDMFGDVDGPLAAAWPDLDLQLQRAIAAAVIHQVRLSRATGVRNRWNPQRINVRWAV